MKGNPKVIAELNVALREELTAINQYFLHAEMCHKWGYHALGKCIKKQSIDEMKHAEKLIERILFLDSMPKMDYLELNVGSDVKGQLAGRLQARAERGAMYNNAIQVSRDNNDDASRELFALLLKDEEAARRVARDAAPSDQGAGLRDLSVEPDGRGEGLGPETLSARGRERRASDPVPRPVRGGRPGFAAGSRRRSRCRPATRHPARPGSPSRSPGHARAAGERSSRGCGGPPACRPRSGRPIPTRSRTAAGPTPLDQRGEQPHVAGLGGRQGLVLRPEPVHAIHPGVRQPAFRSRERPVQFAAPTAERRSGAAGPGLPGCQPGADRPS